MCKHPLKGFKIGYTDSGKDKYAIRSYKVDHLELRNGSWTDAYSSFASNYAEKVIREYTEIPCCKCLDCRLAYSRAWADRCMLELMYHDKDECWFITLTYDDEHIRDFGHDIFPGMLYKRDLQLFFKRLRKAVWKKYRKKIRFYACGEYGSETCRPHYHAIIYSLPLDDLRFIGKTKKGYPLFESEFINKVWTSPEDGKLIGMARIGKVTWDTCAYTARYVIKKANGSRPVDYISQGLEPEFVTMSRRPGIGALYFDDNWKKIYENDEIFFSQDSGGRRAKPCKYFDKKLEDLDPGLLKQIKEKRKQFAMESKKIKLARTDLDYEQLLEIEENVLEQKVKFLPRSAF